MTTPTPQETADQFRNEIRKTLNTIQNRIEQLTDHVMGIENIQADERNSIDELKDSIWAMRASLQQAASQPAPQVGTFGEMMIESIIMTYDDKGKPAYKATGAPYNKFGVRVWDEVLPQLGIDPAKLKPGPNPQTPPSAARVLMNTPEEGKTAQPRKITGKA